tara:strand:- start:619 stop:1254 length:636 start_codon:yes stop_codon:yes gene_type:complete
MKLGIIKYGLGNIGSVFQSLKIVGCTPIIIEKPLEIKNVDKFIFPGVGNFTRSKIILDKFGWTDEILNAAINLKKPILGICLGMQLLAEWGYEGLLENNNTKTEGLGLIKGEVINLKNIGCRERIPHMGWNTVMWNNSPPLLSGIPSNTDFYFVHTYAFMPEKKVEIIATANYSIPVTAIVNKGNIWGTQFHPEKSSKAGLRIIKNFLEYI